MSENIKLVADTITDINKDNIKQILINLRLKTQSSDGIKNLLVSKLDLAAVLDLVNRNINLLEVQDYMLRTAGINYKCHKCDYIEGCSFNPGKVDNCKDVMKENVDRWK